MPPLTNTSAVLSKPGITVSYLDVGTGAASSQNISFLNKTFSLDSGLVVSAGGATFASTVAIAGATSVSSSLTVAQSTVLGAVLDVTGASRFRNQVDVSGALYASSLLDVTGVARLRSTLQVDSAVTLQSTLTVAGGSILTGAVAASNTLTVTGATQLNNSLNVVGATNLSSILNVSSLVTAGNGLTVSGATTLNNALSVAGTSQLTGAVTTTAGVTIGGSLGVTGNTNVAIFTATGAATLSNTLTANGATTINNTLAVSSAINARSALDVVGATTLTTLTTSGSASAGTSLATGTTLNVGTTSILGGNVTANSDVLVKGQFTVSSLSSILGGPLNVAGAAAFGSGIILNNALNMSTSAAYMGSASTIGDFAVGGSLSVAKVSVLQSTLSVAKETTLSDTLTVTKLTTLNDALIVAKEASLQSTLTVAKEAIFQSTLSVAAAATLGGSLSVTGAVTFSDALTVNKAASFVSSVSMNSSLYVAQAASISSLLNVSGAFSIGGALTVTGDTTLGNNLTVQGNLLVNGTTTALETSTIQVKDNAILIADGNTADALQSGLMFQYQPVAAAAPLYAGLKRQATTGEFVFFKDSASQISQSAVATVSVTESYQLDWRTLFDGLATLRLLTTVTSFGSQSVGTVNYTLSAGTYMIQPLMSSSGEWVQWQLTDSGAGKTVTTNKSLWTDPAYTFGVLTGTFTSATSIAYSQYSDQAANTVNYAYTQPESFTTIIARTVSAFVDTYAVVIADSFNCASDLRLKKNIVPLDHAMEKLDQIRGVYHDWIDERLVDRQIGVIAQEIQAVYPELVQEGADGYLSVNYPKLTAVLLQSMKELKELALKKLALKASPTL
jgi:cytoskeletal protein CcmA (bactofilin family)